MRFRIRISRSIAAQPLAGERLGQHLSRPSHFARKPLPGLGCRSSRRGFVPPVIDTCRRVATAQNVFVPNHGLTSVATSCRHFVTCSHPVATRRQVVAPDVSPGKDTDILRKVAKRRQENHDDSFCTGGMFVPRTRNRCLSSRCDCLERFLSQTTVSRSWLLPIVTS